jgi:hypothetical protein
MEAMLRMLMMSKRLVGLLPTLLTGVNIWKTVLNICNPIEEENRSPEHPNSRSDLAITSPTYTTIFSTAGNYASASDITDGTTR